MCLLTVNFALTKDKKTGDFIGYGYKSLKLGRDGKLKGTDYLSTFRKDRWLKADENSLNMEVMSESSYQKYVPGFHLFLSESDAERYSGGGLTRVIAKFKFRGVLAYGTNNTYQDGAKPCIIAQEIKFVEEVKRL